MSVQSIAAKKLVLETFDAFGEGRWDDPSHILRHLADDGEWWVSGSTKMSGTMTKKQMAERLRSVPAFAEGGLKITPLSWIIEGDRVAVEATSSMKLKDGREYKNSFHFVIELRDGKIKKVKEYMDTAVAVEVFGA